MALTWNDRFATGIRQIDLQHQELFELINALDEAQATGNRQTAIEDVLPRLTAYALFHFATEEAMMPRHPGSHAEQHRKQHREFAERIEALRAAPQVDLDLPALVAYLNHWLVEHILKTDRNLSRLIVSSAQ